MMRKCWLAMLCDLGSTVVVFDLDDTLYPEVDYVDSGVRHVCAQIEALYDQRIFTNVKNALNLDPKLDWLTLACELSKLPITAKESLLWMYRLHLPDITLSAHCNEALKIIRAASRATVILTDGRSITQKLKLKALGLSTWHAYISEEYGEPKPSPDRFKIIQEDYPAQTYIYVADNVQKDFLGCNPLGWITVCMRGSNRNVHSQSLESLVASAMPTYWVNGWQELIELLFYKKHHPI